MPHPRALLLSLTLIVASLLTVHTTEANSFSQWDLHAIHAYAARRIATTEGAGVRVCVADTGVSPTADVAVAAGHNAIDPGKPDQWQDDDGHGTFVASEIAGTGTWVDGVAPRATILAVKVLSSGTGSYPTVDAGVLWCITQGANVINLSLGGGSGSFDGMHAAMNLACAHGIAVSVAAGNAGEEHARSHPATITNPCVIVSNALGQRGGVTNWSNFWENMRSVAAPGENVLGDSVNGGPTFMSGTSMAAPLTSGTLALLMGMGVSARDAVRIILLTAGHPPEFLAYNHPSACPRGDALDFGCGVLRADLAVAEARREGYPR